MGTLFGRIAGLKEECRGRRWEKVEQEKEYHELLAEESRLKR